MKEEVPLPKSKPRTKLTIGASELVDFPELGWGAVSARVDTGAATSSIHCSKVELIKKGDQTILQFSLDSGHGAPRRTFSVSDFKDTLVKNSFGQIEHRYVIKTPVVVSGKKIITQFSLADRKKMRFPVLLGRKLLKGRFLVDVAHKSALSGTANPLKHYSNKP